MAALTIILLVLFVIVSLALIFIVSIQSDDSSGLSGVFGGAADQAFGGKTNKVINTITAWLVAAFIILAILLAVVCKTTDSSILATAQSL